MGMVYGLEGYLEEERSTSQYPLLEREDNHGHYAVGVFLGKVWARWT